MIKNIMSNGIYWASLSIVFTTIECSKQTQLLGQNETADNLLFLAFLIYFILILGMSGLTYLLKKFVFVSNVEICCTLLVVGLVIANKYISQIPIYYFIGLTIFHFVYRLKNYMHIEEMKLETKYDDIKEILNLKDDCITVKGSKNKFITSIRGKEISFDGDYSLLFKNKRIKFDIIKQLQMDFNKPFMSFDDNELKIAEMYSI
jgi:hypothetical protein